MATNSLCQDDLFRSEHERLKVCSILGIFFGLGLGIAGLVANERGKRQQDILYQAGFGKALISCFSKLCVMDSQVDNLVNGQLKLALEIQSDICGCRVLEVGL